MHCPSRRSNYSEIPNIAFSSRVPLILDKGHRRLQPRWKARAAHAKLSLCETGAVLYFHKGVVGGLPGRHIREIISAAYEKALYTKPILSDFQKY